MACPRVCLSIVFLLLSAVAQAFAQHGVTSGGRLVNFAADEDAQNLAKRTAGELKGLLDDVGYGAATKELIGDKEYGESSCNANRFEELQRGEIVREIESRPLTPRRKIALQLFFSGSAISRQQVRMLLGDKDPGLIRNLLRQKIAIQEEDGSLRLNNLCLSSLPLHGPVPAGPLYLLSDINKVWSTGGIEPVDTIEITSLSLLRTIEKNQKRLKKLEGVAADLGSGGGIQAIALLRTNPKLTRVIGLEIEPHSINLSRFNALLNGVSDRFVPVNNRKTNPNFEEDALRDALNGEKLALVVTNPPFNLIPESLGDGFTKYGYGGPDGLAVTRLFMRQALANLDPNKGEVILYSQFGLGKNGRPLFEKMLKTDVPSKSGILMSYGRDPMEHLQYGIHARNLEEYAERMSKYLKEMMPHSQVPSSEEFAIALRGAGVEELSPRIAYLKAVGNAGSGYTIQPRGGVHQMGVPPRD
jgi:methylase of polypeptide subunit release factors